MKISLIFAHPNPESFNHAIASAAETELLLLGHQVRRHDLYQEQFNAVLPSAVELESVIRQHCYEIVDAEGIVVVHPNWWGMPPAVLKGWIDRVLRVDVAYRLVTNEKGDGVPQGLLRARSAIVFNTANTPEDRELQAFGDPLETLWKNCIFGLCGVKNVQRRSFSTVVASNYQQRTQWLMEVRKIVKSHFPPEKRLPASLALPMAPRLTA